MTNAAIPLTAVIRAYQRIKPHIRQTPLVYSHYLSERSGG
ncbi:MAG TPA: threonine/serine dehydratase, partial [Anaerolineae bacterium]|nr:threonine/serine dehydratase [Anaerolineae bacterium]